MTQQVPAARIARGPQISTVTVIRAVDIASDFTNVRTDPANRIGIARPGDRVRIDLAGWDERDRLGQWVSWHEVGRRLAAAAHVQVDGPGGLAEHVAEQVAAGVREMLHAEGVAP